LLQKKELHLQRTSPRLVRVLSLALAPVFGV
jgi:hypothetical protein